MDTVTDCEDPHKLQHNAAFHQGLLYLLSLDQSTWTEINYNLENSNSDPFKKTMGSSILIASIYCIRKSTRIQNLKSKRLV